MLFINDYFNIAGFQVIFLPWLPDQRAKNSTYEKPLSH